MMIDDESLLSAYLDGELDPAGRLDVVSASLTDPRLAEELHELSGVRDLLAGLSRPGTPRDLALAVCARIDGRRAPWTSRRAFAPAVAAAAAVLIAVSFGWLWLGSRKGQETAPPVVAAQGPEPAPGSPQQPPIVAENAETDQSRAAEAPERTAPVAVRVAARDDDPEAKTREDAQAHTRKLLDSPNLRRVYIVTDVIGGDAAGRLDALLRQTPRHEPRYARITVCHEIVIDPKHPDDATVFALVLNDRELRQFQAHLKETFPQTVEESFAEPSVVTQLADIGQVAVLSGIAAPEVTIPPGIPPLMASRTGAGDEPIERTQITPGADLGELAGARAMATDESRGRGKAPRITEGLRRPQGQAAPPEERAAASEPVVDREPPGSPGIATASRESSSPDARQEGPESLPAIKGNGRDDAESRGEPSIVLVWVTTRERRGGDPPSGGPGGRAPEPPGAGG